MKILTSNNTFDYHRHSIAGGGAGLYVFRHNTITNNWLEAAIDMHSARNTGIGSGNQFATRAGEIYNNTIAATKFGNGASIGTDIVTGHSLNELFLAAIIICGGDALIYNNSCIGYQELIQIQAFPTYFGDTVYPVHYGPGYNSGVSYGIGHTGTDSSHGDGDHWYWSNTYAPFLSYIPAYFENASPSWFAVDRDYHFSSKPGYIAYTYPHPSTTSV